MKIIRSPQHETSSSCSHTPIFISHFGWSSVRVEVRFGDACWLFHVFSHVSLFSIFRNGDDFELQGQQYRYGGIEKILKPSHIFTKRNE